MFKSRSVSFFFLISLSVVSVYSQSFDACTETGGSLWLDTNAVYGHVAVNGIEENTRFPKVTVTLISRDQARTTATLDRSGKYCFRDVDGSGGVLVIEVEDIEIGRQALPVRSGKTMKQFQQDFEISVPKKGTVSRPGIVSAKYQYPRKSENVKLFDDANTAVKQGDKKKAVQLLKQIVARDPEDFLAWTQLGSVLSDLNDNSAAIEAYQKALAAKPDLAIAMTAIGRIYMLEGKYDLATQTLVNAVKADPTSARSYRLLGEAYIMDRKGSLGVDALNEAIRLEPLAMADGHLLMAKLYDLAGAKAHASREYRLFLEKVPQHPDAKKFQKYIQEHPDTTN
jgi:Tfp pilus assembly protein PilF